MQNFTIYLIQFLWFRGHFHLQFGSGFIDQINRFIRQKTVRNIASGKGCRRYQGTVGNFDVVVGFVTIFQRPQDRNRVFYTGLIDIDLLETSFQGGILFNVFAIFIQRGGTNTAQFAPRQHGFEQVPCIHGPLGGPSANDGMDFVDEENDRSSRLRNFLKNRLKPFFKFTPVFGPGNE